MFVRRQVRVGNTLTTYHVYEPGDAVAEPLPVILFLHGAGESGPDDLAPTTVGIGPVAHRFPALIVFPQATHGYGWRGFNLDAAIAALDDVERTYPTDPTRISVTGISMGGYGTWLLGLTQPTRFATLVPICGGLDTRGTTDTPETAAQKLATIPQWIFHGDADDIIPVEESRAMVRALKAVGAPVRYTEYPGVRHNSWDRAYGEEGLGGWVVGR